MQFSRFDTIYLNTVQLRKFFCEGKGTGNRERGTEREKTGLSELYCHISRRGTAPIKYLTSRKFSDAVPLPTHVCIFVAHI